MPRPASKRAFPRRPRHRAARGKRAKPRPGKGTRGAHRQEAHPPPRVRRETTRPPNGRRAPATGGGVVREDPPQASTLSTRKETRRMVAEGIWSTASESRSCGTPRAIGDRMTRIVPIGLLFLAVLSFDVAVASACSDAGPPNSSCTDDPERPWLACESHADCPDAQVCSADGVCACECRFGEMCEGDACRCAERPDPVVPPGCERVLDTCGGAQVLCPPGDAGPTIEGDPCAPDGGVPAEECLEPKGGDAGGCAAGGGGASGSLLALFGAWLARRSRSRSKR